MILIFFKTATKFHEIFTVQYFQSSAPDATLLSWESQAGRKREELVMNIYYYIF